MMRSSKPKNESSLSSAKDSKPARIINGVKSSKKAMKKERYISHCISLVSLCFVKIVKCSSVIRKSPNPKIWGNMIFKTPAYVFAGV